MLRVFYFAMGFGVLVSGCSTTVDLSDDDRARVRTIRILTSEGEVGYTGRLPSQYEVDDGNGFLNHPWTAPLGVALELATFKKTQQARTRRLKEIFKGLEVDVVSEVRDVFVRDLVASELFSIVNSQADADLVLTVDYGIQGASMLDESWKPWIRVVGVLWGEDDRVLWRKEVELDASSGEIRELPFPDPFVSAANVRRNFQRGAYLLVRELLDHLAGV